MQHEAQAEARDAGLACIAGRGDLALRSSLTEAARDDDAVEVAQATVGQHALDVLGLDPLDLDVAAVVEAAVLPRFDDRKVGVLEDDVIADDAHPDCAVGRLDGVDERYGSGGG